MRILVVDDMPEMIDSLQRMLEMRGHAVGSALTAEGAFAALDEGTDAGPFDAVITDFDLGFGYTGAAVAKDAFDYGIPVCLWSGITRDKCEFASIQLTKNQITELLDWLDDVMRAM